MPRRCAQENREVFQDDFNNWVAPLPFTFPGVVPPNNRDKALSCLFSMRCNLERKPDMKEQFVTFMQKLSDNDHAECATLVPEGK